MPPAGFLVINCLEFQTIPMHGQTAVNKKILAPGKFPLLPVWMKESADIVPVSHTGKQRHLMETSLSLLLPLWRVLVLPCGLDSGCAQVIAVGEVLSQK